MITFYNVLQKELFYKLYGCPNYKKRCNQPIKNIPRKHIFCDIIQVVLHPRPVELTGSIRRRKAQRLIPPRSLGTLSAACKGIASCTVWNGKEPFMGECQIQFKDGLSVPTKNSLKKTLQQHFGVWYLVGQINIFKKDQLVFIANKGTRTKVFKNVFRLYSTGLFLLLHVEH
jgi:hypothetical protein